MAFFTFVLATGAGAAAWLFWNQLSVMQDQLDTLQDLSDKVQKSFDSSRDQSEALRTAIQAIPSRRGGDERAWVGIDSLSIGPLRSSEPLSVAATIRNSGRSPALDVVISLNSKIMPNNGEGPAQRPQCTDCPRLVLLPNAARNITADTSEGRLTAASLDRITSGLDNITLSGRIDYRDADGGAHKTLACFIYQPRISAFSACPTGNHLD
jgi:hypothetical protein